MCLSFLFKPILSYANNPIIKNILVDFVFTVIGRNFLKAIHLKIPGFKKIKKLFINHNLTVLFIFKKFIRKQSKKHPIEHLSIRDW